MSRENVAGDFSRIYSFSGDCDLSRDRGFSLPENLGFAHNIMIRLK